MSLSLKEQLKHWGHYQEHRFCAPLAPEEAPSRDEHPLARAQQFAQGTKRDRPPLLRDGHDRRMLLGAGAGRAGRGGDGGAVPAGGGAGALTAAWLPAGPPEAGQAAPGGPRSGGARASFL